MLTKFFTALIGTVSVVVCLAILAVIGVAVMFIGYFLFWGIIGVLAVCAIWFVFWAIVDEFRGPYDTDDPGP